MVYLTRIKYTAAQRADIWDRWQRGESLTAIGRLFDRPFSSILICWQRRVVFVLRFDSDHAWHSSPQNAKRYPEGWRVAYLCAPSLRNLAVLPRRSAVNFISYIATLVERHTRYVMLAKVKNKDTESVISALIKQSKKLPSELYKSLTWDRGHELADHQRFTLATHIKVYFCDPSSPWQRGSNENTNRLLRQYFPKVTNLSVHSQAKLNAVARQLNERPRKTLEFETPAERFDACVASIG